MGIRRLIHGDAMTVTDIVAKNHYFKSFDRKTIHVKEKYSVGMERHDRKVVCFPPCIYSHNFFDCPVLDYSIMDYLADKGFKVYAYDPRGFGSSYHPSNGKSISYKVEFQDAEALVNFVLSEAGTKNVSMVAFGSGAQVACGYAIHHPAQVDALVLMDFVWKFLPGVLSPQFKKMLLSQPNGYLQLNYVSDLFDNLLRFTTAKVLAWVKSEFIEAPVGPLLTAFKPFPLIKPAAKIQASILIIRGSQAEVTSESDSFDFLKTIDGQVRAYDILKSAGPVPSLEKRYYKTVLGDMAWFLTRFGSNIEE